MRRNGRIDAGFQENFHQPDEIAVDVRLALESDCWGFEVGPLAETNAYTEAAKQLHVRAAATKVRLDYGSDSVVAGVQSGDQAQRAVGVGARFHIDADEVVQPGCDLRQTIDIVAA